jgi:hypothetical protein
MLKYFLKYPLVINFIVIKIKLTSSNREIFQIKVELEDKAAFGDSAMELTRKASGKQRLLQYLNSHITVGTEIGQYVYVDWIPQKEADSAKLISKFYIQII